MKQVVLLKEILYKYINSDGSIIDEIDSVFEFFKNI